MSTSTAIVKTTRRDPGKEYQRRRWKLKKLVRFLSLGHFLRTYTIPPRPHLKRNDEFTSWKSLFFYRCTDKISFALLKSQPGRRVNEPAKPRGPVPVPQESNLATGSGWGGLFLGVLEQTGQQEGVKAHNGQLEKPHAPVEPKKAEEKTVLWEKTKEERRTSYTREQRKEDRRVPGYIREKAVAAAPPRCSPKTIYVLASFVRRSSIGSLTHGTNISRQAQNSAPLRYRLRGHKKQSDFGQRCGRGFLVGHRWVREGSYPKFRTPISTLG